MSVSNVGDFPNYGWPCGLCGMYHTGPCYTVAPVYPQYPQPLQTLPTIPSVWINPPMATNTITVEQVKNGYIVKKGNETYVAESIKSLCEMLEAYFKAEEANRDAATPAR